VKVVLFCGGKGIRLSRGASDTPKPLVRVGFQPIVWNVMKFYAHFGHKDFILCLGHKSQLIKKFFLRYSEALSNDFVLAEGGSRVDVLRKDMNDWRITFCDTGLNSTIGQRLLNVREHLKGEEMFLANYADGLSNVDLNAMINHFKGSGATASFLCVKPQQSFHVVNADNDGRVRAIEPMSGSQTWINGGFFCLRQELFEHMREGDELVQQPFERLIKQNKLLAYKFNGFWGSMDTFKDKQTLEAMITEGRAPWQVWTNPAPAPMKPDIVRNA
jgi:glucose-1-phosphate cytidylyltransferase